MHFLSTDFSLMHAEALRAEALREAQARAARQGQVQPPRLGLRAIVHRLFAAPVRPA
jgi:hypothetical protein